jgi:hypothetical protein
VESTNSFNFISIKRLTPSSHDPAMDSPETPENVLRTWYSQLWAPKVDLIGDIAGKEPFIIHGESLIRHCLEESPANFQGE